MPALAVLSYSYVSPFTCYTQHVTKIIFYPCISQFGMFSLFIREKVCDLSSSYLGPTDSNIRFSQLYIGEACWAFLFGVIIGESAISVPDITTAPAHAWRCPLVRQPNGSGARFVPTRVS